MAAKSTQQKDNQGREILVGDILLDNWLVIERDGEFLAVDAQDENSCPIHKLEELLSTNLYKIISR